MSIINPKFRISVYSDVDFKEEPYDTTKKFSVFIPKPKDVIQELLDKHESSVKARDERMRTFQRERQAEKEKLALMKVKTMNTSPKNSPTTSPTKTTDPNVRFGDTEGDMGGIRRVLELEAVMNDQDGAESKVKTKLRREVEMARTMDDDLNRREVQFEDTIQKSAFGDTIQNPSIVDFGESMNQRMYQTADARSFKSAGKSNRSRGTSSKDFRSTFTRTSKLKNTLFYDTRTQSVPKTSLKNKVIEDIIDKEAMVLSNPVLYQSILKLRDMQLLKLNDIHMNKYKGVGKINYVYNDYHSRSTNPGYSRNTAGAFYYR